MLVTFVLFSWQEKEGITARTVKKRKRILDI
jgi:hypothetical protein